MRSRNNPADTAKLSLPTEEEERWAAVLARDARADGRFVYSVRSTGIYCRPSCPSRRPSREQVCFHENPQAAELAGFRACKRCDPKGEGVRARQVQLVTHVCRLLETSEEEPSLAELAGAVGLSPFHLQRLFRRLMGMSPKQYAKHLRLGRFKRSLRKSGTVTEAIYEGGFGSSGRFYEESQAGLGMKPSTLKKGGQGERLRFGIGQCALGSVLVAASEKGLCFITLGDDPERLVQELQESFPKAELVGGDRQFEGWMARVIGFVETPVSSLDLPLDIRGTAFQRRVWAALRTIPVGQTLSYAQLAAKLGAPQAARAVGTACGANKLAFAIPCHRVVRRDGALSGYRWGIARKRRLLEKERTVHA